MQSKSKLRILFNDAHSNLPAQKHVPQGGPSRFSAMFTGFFEKGSQATELISILYSHNAEDDRVYVRKTEGHHAFFEVVYPREMLSKSYKADTTKKKYLEFLEPLVQKTGEVLDESKPDVVFLNGYSLSNWMLLEAAYRRGIPACIQHAGLWKKEVMITTGAFSPSIKRIFNGFEKEVLEKTAHQIFLNEFSRREFFKLHNVSLAKFASKTSIVPLPIEIEGAKKKVGLAVRGECKVGMVARWDKIKNHGAAMRLSKYVKKNRLPARISVVTRWHPALVSDFRDAYQELVRIVDPMHPDELKHFYDSQDVIIIPSRFDVSPTVLMEALLCGKPVLISSNVGWVSDFEKFKLGQMVFSPRASGETIYGALDRLMQNAASLLPKYDLLRDKIVREHGTKVVFGQYYKIFKSIA